MSSENLQATRRIYEAMARGDFWATGAEFDPEIVWEWSPSLAGLTGTATYHGIEGVIEATLDFFKAWDFSGKRPRS